MPQKIKSNRGTTLAELIIVMAVVSIMSTMVVTFSVLVNGWVRVGTEKYNLSQSEHISAEAFREFVSYFDDDMHIFSVTDGEQYDSLTASSTEGETVYTMYYTDGVLHYTAPDGDPIREAAFPLDNVTAVTFTYFTSRATGKQIIYCHVDYILTSADDSLTETGRYTVAVTTRSARVNSDSENSETESSVGGAS